jgi:hypothetical protein
VAKIFGTSGFKSTSRLVGAHPINTAIGQAFDRRTHQEAVSLYLTMSNIRSFTSSRKAITCSLLTVGKPSKKTVDGISAFEIF